MGLLGKILNRSSTKKSCDTASTKPNSVSNGPSEDHKLAQAKSKKYESSLHEIH